MITVGRDTVCRFNMRFQFKCSWLKIVSWGSGRCGNRHCFVLLLLDKKTYIHIYANVCPYPIRFWSFGNQLEIIKNFIIRMEHKHWSWMTFYEEKIKSNDFLLKAMIKKQIHANINISDWKSLNNREIIFLRLFFYIHREVWNSSKECHNILSRLNDVCPFNCQYDLICFSGSMSYLSSRCHYG